LAPVNEESATADKFAYSLLTVARVGDNSLRVRLGFPEKPRSPAVGKTERRTNMPQYTVQLQWSGTWHPGGVWTIAGETPTLVSLNVTSPDNGQTFSGVTQFAGQGGIEVRGTNNGNGTYAVQLQWGGSGAPWNAAGNWSFGGNSILSITVNSANNGQTITGTMQMPGQGGVDVQGTLSPS